MPILEDAEANLICSVATMLFYGTHSIVVALVKAVRLGKNVAPLVYLNGDYCN